MSLGNKMVFLEPDIIEYMSPIWGPAFDVSHISIPYVLSSRGVLKSF